MSQSRIKTFSLIGLLLFVSFITAVGFNGAAKNRAAVKVTPVANESVPLTLKLKTGDHILIIGNTLAERMQHFGHFETLLHSTFAHHRLFIRNLGYSGDEVMTRPRSQDFGDPDKYLTKYKASVVFAMFGFNESFAGKEGLESFEKDYARFIKQTLSQKYDGKSAPRLVLFSPLAHEDLKNKHVPDGSKNNKNIALYTESMRRIAAEAGVQFVDLFTITKQLMAESKTPLTFNGIHLTNAGYKALSAPLVEALIGKEPTQRVAYEKIRAEVLERNYQFHHVYRAVNGFYIYGGRSRRDHGNPPYTDAYVVENERNKLDEMCGNRDQRIWKVAQGLAVSKTIDDSNTRALYKVPTNFKRKTTITPPEKALKMFHLPKGYEINLFASEVDFPDLKNPVNMTFDAKGRLWISTMPSYPGYIPGIKPRDQLLIFEDTNGDGKADKQTVFADDLHLPTGFELGDGGAYVAQEPNFVFLKDTDGDGKYDTKKILLHGFDSGDSHHAIGAFQWGPGGGIYMHEGTFHHTSVETQRGVKRNFNAGVFRYQPTRKEFDIFVTYRFANPWGHAFDEWGQNFIADASGGRNYFAAPFSGNLDHPQKHPSMRTFFQKRVRPTAGCEFVSSRHFPPEAQGNFLLTNCIGFQGILQHTMQEDGSGIKATEIEPLLYSDDTNFRPISVQFGPDGALYVVDWFNALIGHMQHSLRDPNRDHAHGRIWRITYPSRPLLTAPKIAGEPINKLLSLLRSPEYRTRYRVRLALREHAPEEVAAEIKTWLAGLDPKADDFEHCCLEALWVHQHHDLVNLSLLKHVLASKEPRARAAATRVLCNWRNQVPNSLEMIRKQINDPFARVRLEAVRACSFYENSDAADVALEYFKHDRDYYLNYAFTETMRQLKPFWRKDLLAGKVFAKKNPAGMQYLLNTISEYDLVQIAPSRLVYKALLSRPQIEESFRVKALAGLAKLNHSSEVKELLNMVKEIDRSTAKSAAAVLNDLAQLLTKRPAAELKIERSELARLTTVAHQAVARQIAYVVLMTADDSVNPAWELANRSPKALHDFLNSIPLIPQGSLRRKLHVKVEPVLYGNFSFKVNAATKTKIRKAAINAITYIPGHDDHSFESFAEFFQKGELRESIVSALSRLKKDRFPKDEIQPLVDSMVQAIKETPIAQRDLQSSLSLIQMARDLARLLPVEVGRPIISNLRQLGVQIVHIRCVPHKMQFDHEEIAIEAGKNVVIVFENTDIMPHNFVITTPKGFDTVVAKSSAMTGPTALAKGFIPKTRHVLQATKLLQTGQSQTLKFVAPKKPGLYRYLCTFPNHPKTMHGIVHVVKNMDTFLANYTLPEPIGAEPTREFVKDYKTEDIKDYLDWKKGSRDFARGKELFSELTCIQCHHMDKDEDFVGPSLSNKMLKRTRLELLESLVDPSKVMDKKYKQMILFVNGKVLTGVVTEQNEEFIILVENPLIECEPLKVLVEDLDEEPEYSDISVMPEKLLNTMKISEILDLLAYIASKGDHKNTSFNP